MNELSVKHIKAMVKKDYTSATDALGRDFYKSQIKAMIPIAQEVTPLYAVDEEVVTLAVILHTFELRRAKEFLPTEGYPDDKVGLVGQCIQDHRSGLKSREEAVCLTDAVNLLHILDVPSLYFQAYHQDRRGLSEGVAWVQGRLEKSWEQISTPSQTHFQATYDVLRHIFQGIRRERYNFESDLERTLADFVETACKSEKNSFGYGIWENHISPMVSIAMELAPLHGADGEVVRIAALLHDLSSIEDISLAEEHHIHGAYRARAILSKAGYPADKTELVAQCILHHRGSVRLPKETAEERCLTDADAIAHMSDLPSLLYVTFGRQKANCDDGKRWVMKKIKRDWKKMSTLAHEKYQEQYDTILKYL